MSTIAGVLLVTSPGAAVRVAARLASAPGFSLAGGDGDSRVAAVWQAPDATTLEVFAERLLADDPEVLGVYPTFVADEEG